MKKEFNYISYRNTSRSGQYKLRKRTEKMLKMIARFKNYDPLSILDIGAADGVMLNQFKSCFKGSLCVGIEPSLEFITSRDRNSCTIIQAIGENIPFKDGIFDVITAASVLDHMENSSMFLREAHRTLKKNGILVISLVSPYYDKLAVKFRIKDDDHKFRFNEKQLCEILKKKDFDVVEISRFALPFFGFFFEEIIKKTLEAVGLKCCMFYIIAVARVRK